MYVRFAQNKKNSHFIKKKKRIINYSKLTRTIYLNNTKTILKNNFLIN